MSASTDKVVAVGNKVTIRSFKEDEGVLATIVAVHANAALETIRIEVAEAGAKRRVFTYRKANGDYVERDTPTFSGPWIDMIWHPSQRSSN